MKHQIAATTLIVTLIVCLCSCLTIVVSAAPGDLDTTFAGTGRILVGFGSANDLGNALAMQTDGKIVVAGTSNGKFGILRYNTDGSLDTSFDGDGKVTTALNFFIGDAVATAVKIQTNGKIVVAGHAVQVLHGLQTTEFVVVRYNSDGSLDTSFDDDGIATRPSGQGNAMAIQADGKIVVVGSSDGPTNSDFVVARYNTDGSADTSFDTDGIVSTSIGPARDHANAVTIFAGKIIVAGSSDNGSNNDFAVVRYNADGSLPIAQQNALVSVETEGSELVLVLLSLFHVQDKNSLTTNQTH